MVKAALQLTPDQEKLWAPVEAQVRDTFKAREAKIEEWKKKREERKAENEKGGEHKHADLAQRFEKLSQRAAERADRLKAFSSAFSPFYASLSDEQKDVLRPLARQLSPGFGGRGHRFADGWGPGGRHHGWFGHGGHGGHMQMQNNEDNDDNDGGPCSGSCRTRKEGLRQACLPDVPFFPLAGQKKARPFFIGRALEVLRTKNVAQRAGRARLRSSLRRFMNFGASVLLHAGRPSPPRP